MSESSTQNCRFLSSRRGWSDYAQERRVGCVDRFRGELQHQGQEDQEEWRRRCGVVL